MSAYSEQTRRQVVPRWRNFRLTRELGELDSAAVSIAKVISIDESFFEKLQDWKNNGSVSFAADLVGAALAFAKSEHPDVLNAAHFLVDRGDLIPSMCSSLARGVIAAAGKKEMSFIHEIPYADPPGKLQKDVQLFRKRLTDEPRNALLWTDLARTYIMLGCPDAASRAMRIALGLAPGNRFVLRAATRLHLHLGNADVAHELLKRSVATKHDPWVMAAEIAVSSVMGRTSRLVKFGKGFLVSKAFLPKHLAELGCAIATLELEAGNAKVARKLFRSALIDPTENSVAQAGWASKWLGEFSLTRQNLNVPRSFEAKALHYRQNADWPNALKETVNWLEDQPFSERPATFGSYVACMFLEDYKEGERIATVGLLANPKSATLLNNAAFACASDNRLIEAQAYFDKIDNSKLSEVQVIVHSATDGLLSYRRGEIEKGRARYLRALELAKGQAFEKARMLAAIILVREEILAKTRESSALKTQLLDQLKPVSDPEVIALKKRLAKQPVESAPVANPFFGEPSGDVKILPKLLH